VHGQSGVFMCGLVQLAELMVTCCSWFRSNESLRSHLTSSCSVRSLPACVVYEHVYDGSGFGRWHFAGPIAASAKPNVAEADSDYGDQRGGKTTAEKGLATGDGGAGSRSCRRSTPPRESDAGERPDEVCFGAGMLARGGGGTGDAGGDGGRRCFSSGTGDTAGTGDAHGDDCYDPGNFVYSFAFRFP